MKVKMTGVLKHPYKDMRKVRKRHVNLLKLAMRDMGATLPVLLEAHMKQNAKWKDRTGDARASLYAQGKLSRKKLRVVASYHRNMPNFIKDGYYAVKLENVVFPRAGYLAIIKPTISIFFALFGKSMVNILKAYGFHVRLVK